MKEPTGHREEDAGRRIRRRDDCLASDGIEKVSDREWAKRIPQGERQEIAADAFLGHAIKPHQHERVCKEDRVVEKRLRQHENETEQRTPTMDVHNRVPNFPPGCVRARADSRRGQWSVGVEECWSNGNSLACLAFHIAPILLYPITPAG